VAVASGKAGRSAALRLSRAGRSAGMAARLMVMSSGGGEGGRPTWQLLATRGLVEEPVAAHAAGNAAADIRSLPAGLGKTQRPVDRGAGGNRCQSALPCGTRRLPPTRPTSPIDGAPAARMAAPTARSEPDASHDNTKTAAGKGSSRCVREFAVAFGERSDATATVAHMTDEPRTEPVTYFGQPCGVCGEPIYRIVDGRRDCGHAELDLLCLHPEPCECLVCRRRAAAWN